MKIELLTKYKSLSPFISDELNDFTAIIGANGSGKTQLLDAINANKNNNLSIISRNPVNNIQMCDLELDNLSYSKDIKLKSISSSYYDDYHKITNYSKSIWVFYDYLYKNVLLEKKEIDSIIDNRIWLLRNMNYYSMGDRNLLSKNSDYLSVINSAFQENLDLLKKLVVNGQTVLLNSNYFGDIFYKESILLLLFLSKNASYQYFVTNCISINNKLTNVIKNCFFVAENRNKDIKNLTEVDFSQITFPLEETNLFNIDIEKVFLNYAKLRHDNDYNFFRKKTYDEINNAVTDEDFIIKYPKPWDVINNILKKYNINFFYIGLESKDFYNGMNYKLNLYKKDTNEPISCQDLSSGEKLIIGLCLILFNNQFYSENLQLPDLVLLDEPDAHLHPEMTKMLIDILKDVFVKKFNIKVIISTHNPSTIALLDDDSIYQMTNGEKTSLKKINKDDALKLLTSFIPSLTIDYRNHKQVFVESPTDVEYYQTIYNKLAQEIKFDYKLYFMSCAYGEGTCKQVVKVVNDFQHAGVQTVFGVIDWDLKNNNKGNVKVHGYDSRYSIENYLCDPLYVSILFIEENFYSFADILDYCLNSSYSLPQNKIKAQQAVELFFDKLCKDNEKLKLKYEEKKEVYYGNDLKLQLPANFLREKGHDFVNLIRDKFPSLIKYNDDKKLAEKMTTIIARCYPYIPQDTLDLIYDLAVISTDE